MRDTSGESDRCLPISGSLRKLSKKVLYDHLNNCVKDSIQKGETDVLESFADILEKYI